MSSYIPLLTVSQFLLYPQIYAILERKDYADT
jgi:hypothetical protein